MFSFQTEENTLMKEALGKMKNSKEKNMCWQDGRLFEDKEDWIVDSCTKCTCQVVSRQMCRFSVQCRWWSRYSLMTGVQDCVSPNNVSPGGLCQSLIFRWRVLPRLSTWVFLFSSCFCHKTYSLKKSWFSTGVFTVTSCGQWRWLVPLVRVDRVHCHLWYRNPAKGALMRRN